MTPEQIVSMLRAEVAWRESLPPREEDARGRALEMAATLGRLSAEVAGVANPQDPAYLASLVKLGGQVWRALAALPEDAASRTVYETAALASEEREARLATWHYAAEKARAAMERQGRI